MQLKKYEGRIVLLDRANESHISEFEQDFRLSMPEELKIFLLQSNGCGVLWQYILLNDNSFELCISLFGLTEISFAIDNIKKIEAEYHYYFSDVILPIGDPGGARYLGIGLKGEYKGKIYIMHYQDYDYENLFSMLTFVASSIEELLNRLVIECPNN